MTNNKFKGFRVEFHILQSFPVSCLNRDDVGSPKSAIIGGVPRARVSSQCWKRAVRMQMRDLDVKIGLRTKFIIDAIAEKCKKYGADDKQARQCGEWFAKAVGKIDKKDEEEGKSNTLFFITDSEADAVAKEFKDAGFKEIENKKLQKIAKNALNPAKDGLDIALFGRMVANAADMNIEAAASFAHAISTHRVDSEIDFFTAVDDCRKDEDSGSAHMGTLEFNSATYYRYVSLDLGQLAATLKSDDIADSVVKFTQALFLAVPAARQATMSAANPWNYAIVAIRQGQRLQIPFTTPVKGSDLLPKSINEIKKQFADAKKLYGSLFRLRKEIEIGLGDTSIDDLTNGLSQAIAEIRSSEAAQ
jgi:CRISPR system Cascade subunit CasC